MANAHRGQHVVEFDGVKYTLKYSLDALASIEETCGDNIQNIMTNLGGTEKPNLRVIQKIFHAGLLEFQPEMTLQQAGRLGTASEIMAAIVGALFGSDDKPTEAASTGQGPT